jgi:predicted DNA-binding transcriptional regulator AlpA
MTEMQGLLRQKQILKLIPVSAAAWWRGIQEGRYPQGHKLGPKTTVWKALDIQAIIDRLGSSLETGGGA